MRDLPCFSTRSSETVPGLIGPSANRYLQLLELEGHAPGTIYEYHRELTWLGERYPDLEPGDFTHEDIEDYLLVRAEGRSPATRKKVLSILRGYFRHLHDRGQIRRNPTAPIKTPKLQDPDPSYWDPDDIRRILKAPMPARDHLLLEMFARTGQRMESVRMLTWDRIDLDGKEPMIHFPGKDGKYGKSHDVGIHQELLHDLIVFKRMTHPDPEGYVFLSNQGKPLSHQQVNRVIHKACKAAGVRVRSAHEFRRSCITNMLQAGVPLDVVSKDIANHASVATTMKHYRGAARERQRQALKALPY